ncbi:ABC transporter substrate-binding protein [Streptomyces sp. NPDC048282]|uniref:ABC transporter substrate-binding protein n=1 Tax=Streptomyces sp. NPDC048282 TaxID=3365528 RepID=UPI00371DA049
MKNTLINRFTGVAAAATTMALALTGCGSTDSGSDAGSGQLQGRGPITYAASKTEVTAAAPLVKAWNAKHPDEKVTVVNLGAVADQSRQLLIQSLQTKSSQYAVLNLDVIWTGEFAAHRWIRELDPKLYPMDEMLKAAVAASTYRGKLYAVPTNIEGGLLYYRTDLLKAAGVESPPTTWAEMKTDCAKVKATKQGAGVDCYAGQFDKYEGLTVNFAEAVNSAGGVILDKDGKPDVDTPQALTGLTTLVDAFKSGMVPKNAITLQEESGRQAFQDGKLLFHRQWSYQYALANARDGSSKVAGKFAVTTLPGIGSHPGVSSLGGHVLAISAFAKNSKTASDFVAYLGDAASQRAGLENFSISPATAATYDDPALVKKYPFLPTSKKVLQNAVPRPISVSYGDITAAIQEQAYAAITGKKTPAEALKALQSALEAITG